MKRWPPWSLLAGKPWRTDVDWLEKPFSPRRPSAARFFHAPMESQAAKYFLALAASLRLKVPFECVIVGGNP